MRLRKKRERLRNELSDRTQPSLSLNPSVALICTPTGRAFAFFREHEEEDKRE